MSTPGSVIRRFNAFVPQRGTSKIALDDLEVLAKPIELAEVTLDGKPFVLRQDLVKKAMSVRLPRTDRRADRGDQKAPASAHQESIVSVLIFA
jgi:hypothetical protein